MAVTATLSNHFKYQLAKKQIDLSADSIKILLMRNGFTFDKDNHATKANIKASTGTTTLSVNSSLQFTRATGSFISDGFVAGNQITSSGFSNSGNNTTKIISSVTETAITVTDTTGLVEESGDGDEQISANDELASGNGYTQDTKTLSNQSLTEDDTDDRAEFTCDDVSWTASGGDIGPSPGAILYDDTSSDDTIIGYLDFDGNKTAPSGENFNIKNIAIHIS